MVLDDLRLVEDDSLPTHAKEEAIVAIRSLLATLGRRLCNRIGAHYYCTLRAMQAMDDDMFFLE
jgi:hypothetical protein